jgi:uncharacterized protein YcfL
MRTILVTCSAGAVRTDVSMSGEPVPVSAGIYWYDVLGMEQMLVTKERRKLLVACESGCV